MIISRRWLLACAGLCALFVVGLALNQSVLAQQQSASGSIGLEGTLPSPPPSRGATITIPSNGQSFTQIPITVQGLCPGDVLVKIFKNNVFAGATECKNGSYSLKIDLFSGKNELVARVYDNLDQAGPDSNKPVVTYNDALFESFGTHVSLSSDYAKRGVDPGKKLEWPIILTGGQGPYAISVDWGDGSDQTLISRDSPGTFTIDHVYQSPGFYNILIKATDKNGGTAFLQVVGVANGPAAQTASSDTNTQRIIIVKVIWWPVAVVIPLLVVAFWLGRRHELFVLRRQIEARQKK